MDLLLLALRPMILPDPGMQRVFVHSELARALRDSLLRLDGQFDGALLECSGILSRRGLAHRTHLVYCVSSLSPCVRKSITTSPPDGAANRTTRHTTRTATIPLRCQSPYEASLRLPWASWARRRRSFS